MKRRLLIKIPAATFKLTSKNTVRRNIGSVLVMKNKTIAKCRRTAGEKLVF